MNKQTCIDTNQITAGDLDSFIVGDASDDIKRHVFACAYCANEVAQLQQVAQLFSQTLFRSACPPTEDLLQYGANLLSNQATDHIKKHLESCHFCPKELAQITAVAPAVSAPSFLEQLKETAQTVIQAVRLSLPAQPAYALRGGERKQLLYQADAYEIVLGLEPPIATGAQWQVEGQVSLESDPLFEFEGAVDLAKDGEVVAEDVVDGFGYFDLGGVNAGIYTLNLQLNQQSIQIDQLTVA